MKKLFLALSLLITTLVLADERPKPDSELLVELKQYCTELAQEDGTGGKDLQVFLLECVNEELDAEGFQLLTKLD